MNSVKLKKWNSAEHLKSDEDMALYSESVSNKLAATPTSLPRHWAQLPEQRT